jgi:integrase
MDTKHLKRRHNVYWVRVWVPEPLRGILGKSELWQNLYTTDLAEANRKKHRVVAELMEVIEQAKRDREGTLDKVSREEKLKQYALKYTRESDAAKNNDDEDVEDFFDEAIEAKIYELYGDKDGEGILNFGHPESDASEKNPSAVKALIDSYKIHTHDYEPISSISKLFLSEESESLKPSSFRRKKKHIEQFIKWSGDRDISKITKKIAGEYVTSIISNKNPAYDTLRNIVGDISSLFSWAEGRGYLDRNPFYKLKLPKADKGSQKRRQWANEEILMFLSSSKIGINEFTATVVGMYSGMRLDEICNIQKAHISDNCFRILEGKTKAAKRKIPIHPVIGPLVGRFLDSSKDDYLIKGIKSGGYDKKRSWNFQKKLGRLRKQIGIPGGIVFHTLRNTFATHMENAGVPVNHISQLMGHEDSHMALTVYSGGLRIEPLVESINKLTYGEELDSFIKEALTEKSNVEENDKITDMELLAKLQTSESILGSRILRNVREGD